MIGSPYVDEPVFTAVVQQLPFLADIPNREVEYFLRRAARQRTLRPREVLFAQDERLESIYLILSGQIAEARSVHDRHTTRTRQTLRRTVGAGTLLARYDLILQQPYSTRARAVDTVQVVEINAAAMNRLLQRYPHVRLRFAPFELIGRLRTIPIFGPLDLTQLGFIADAGEQKSYGEGDVVYQSGDPVATLYVIDQGQVRLNWYRGLEEEAWLGNGAAFGVEEDVPPGGSAVSALNHSAVATCTTKIFQLQHQAYFDITGRRPGRDARQLRQAREQILDSVPVFDKWSPEQRKRLAGFVSHYYIPIHHVVMQQGEVGDSLWVLMPDSHAQSHALDKNGQALPRVPVIGPNFFDEIALRVQLPLDSTVEAEPGSQWLRLHWRDFRLFCRLEGGNLLNQLSLSEETQSLLRGQEMRKRYSWLSAGETLITIQKRHWIALVRKVTPALFVGFLTLLALVVTAQSDAFPGWLYGVWMLTALFSVGYFIWGVLDYRNDYLLVTNQRVVRQEKVIFFKEMQQVAFLEQVQNVDFATSFVGNLLGYGIIRIQTAGATGSIVFDFAPEPPQLKTQILTQRSQRQLHYRANSRMIIQRLLEERFGLRPEMPSRVRAVDDEGRPPTRDLSGWEMIKDYARLDRHMRRQQSDRIIWRKHWFILLRQLVWPLIVFLVTLVLMLSPLLLQNLMASTGLAIELIAAFAFLVCLAWTAWIVADWRNDTYEVGAVDVVDVEKKPLFFAEIRRTARLGQIENIELEIPSPLNYLLNYGNVRLQTAATEGDFTFDGVPDPRGVAEELRRRIEQYHRREEEDRARKRAEELPDWFETFSRLDDDINSRA